MRIITPHSMSFVFHRKELSRIHQCRFAFEGNTIQSCFAADGQKLISCFFCFLGFLGVCVLMWPWTLQAGCCVAKEAGKVTGKAGDFWSIWRAAS